MASSDPASGFSAVTKSDSATLPTTTRALYVGTGGDLTVQGGQGQSVLFKAIPAGMILPIVATKVMATGTTAADLVALY